MEFINYKIQDKEYSFYFKEKDHENIFHMSYPKINLNNFSNIILDIGGNIGSSAIYFHSLYPNSTIHVFEPDPENYETLIKNTFPFDNIKPYNFGLFDESKNANLQRSPFGSSGNSIYLRPEISCDIANIELKKASEITASILPNILKIDTEGCEIPILSDILTLPILFDVIYIEYHCDEDRFEIEKMMYPTYNLIHAKVVCKNIGELTYINKNIKGYDCSGMKLPNQKGN